MSLIKIIALYYELTQKNQLTTFTFLWIAVAKAKNRTRLVKKAMKVTMAKRMALALPPETKATKKKANNDRSYENKKCRNKTEIKVPALKVEWFWMTMEILWHNLPIIYTINSQQNQSYCITHCFCWMCCTVQIVTKF